MLQARYGYIVCACATFKQQSSHPITCHFFPDTDYYPQTHLLFVLLLPAVVKVLKLLDAYKLLCVGLGTLRKARQKIGL